MSRRRFWISSGKSVWIATVTLAFLCTSCGNSNNNSISNAQAQAISQEFVTAAQSAMTGQFYGGGPGDAHASLSKILHDARPESSSGCTPTSNGQTCIFPISYTGPCPSGGTISVSGDFNLTLNSSGTGSDDSSLRSRPPTALFRISRSTAIRASRLPPRSATRMVLSIFR